MIEEIAIIGLVLILLSMITRDIFKMKYKKDIIKAYWEQDRNTFDDEMLEFIFDKNNGDSCGK